MLWQLAKASPHQALAEALVASESCTDPETRSWIDASIGRAHFELGRNEEAITELERAIDAAPDELRGRAIVSLAAALSAAGRLDEATAHLQRVVASEDSTVSALANSQLGMVLLHSGNVVGALESIEPAIGQLQGVSGEEWALASSLGNAGYCELILGRLDSAIQRFRQAAELATETNQLTIVAGCLQNIGFALMRKGDLVGALTELERARESYRANGDPGRNLSTLLDDLAETYRVAGLTHDAVRTAEQAVALVSTGGNLEKQGDALYRLARCQLDSGSRAAIATASDAAQCFERAGRDHWLARSRLLEAEALAELGSSDHAELMKTLDHLAGFEAAGWELEERSVRNVIALEQVRARSFQDARRALGATSAVATDQGVMAQIEGHLSSAITATLSGESLEPHADAASDLVRSYALRLADPEMRAGATRLMNRLRRLFVGEAVDAGDANAAFGSEERFRSIALSLPRATPARDESIAALSQQLRDLSRSLEESGQQNPAIDAELRSLEQKLRHRSLRQKAEGGGIDNYAIATTDDLLSKLGNRTWVEWFELDDALHVIACRGDQVSMNRCDHLKDITKRCAEIRRGLARLARPGLSESAASRRWATLESDCADVAAQLLPPTLQPAPGESWILSPPTFLIDLPWSLILRGSGSAPTVTVAPSASWWLARQDGEASSLRFGSLVGPDLQFASMESHALAQRFGRMVSASTSVDALAAISDSTLLHVASHGVFRNDSPRFSSLRLEDGPLALHELDRIEQLPDAVVLAACDAGRHTSTAGGDLLGFAPSWLAAGTRAVIAPICAVGDEPTTHLVDGFYRQLGEATGSGVATALAVAQASSDKEPSEVRAAAHSFVTLGCDVRFVSEPTEPFGGMG